MIWDGRRDHLEGDMTSIVSITSSLVGDAKGSLELSFIKMSTGSMMLRKIEENNHKNINARRTSRKVQKL